jgi:deoxycytidine triphosphate deaminase
MILSDRDLRALLASGRLVVEPLDPGAVQPSSIDLRVGSQFRVFANSRHPYIDVRQPMEGLTDLVEATEEEPFILHPGEFVLGSTLESVAIPDDVVGRLEGKSSLGRLGLLIHSSLPGSEPVLVRGRDGSVRWRAIEEVVRKQLRGDVVAFDPETFAVDYHQITNWYEGPADRIFEVVLASGRSVQVTAGHNLFTLDGGGQVTKVRTGELATGRLVAIGDGVSLETGPTDDELLVLTTSAAQPRQSGRTTHQRRLSTVGARPGGDLRWDRVVEVRDTGVTEPIFDLEVRPGGRRIENFLAGRGGVFVSNTAGFVDAGFRGNLTLELSNVANLPITIYPGMKIGQLCIFQMTSPAERPYGSEELRSKYLGQEGPTPSRFHENFDDRR